MNVPPTSPPYLIPKQVKPSTKNIPVGAESISADKFPVSIAVTVNPPQATTTQKEKPLETLKKWLEILVASTTILPFLEKMTLKMIQWLKRGGEPKK
jgi:hypothetical protein